MSNQIGSLKMGQKFKKTPAGTIPMDWGVATIADLCQVNPEVIKESTPPDTQLKYIDIASIERTGNISIPKDMEFKDAPSRARRIVKAGDIIVSTVRPYLRAFARVTDLSENLIASTGFAVLRARPNVNGSYVYQHVLSDTFVKYLEEKMTGSSYPAVNSSDVAEYQMPVPMAMEQENIGRILADVDTLMDKVGAEIKKTKELKKGLMRQLLTRGIVHKKFKNTLVGKIPADWNVKKIEEIAQLYSGGTPYREKTEYFGGTVPWVKSGELNRSPITKTDECITEAGLQNSSAKLVPENTVLIALYGATAGQVAMLRIKAAINQAILAVLPTAEILKDYLYFLLKFMSPKLISITQGSGQPNLSQELIARTDIPIPPISEQEKIADILYGLDVKIIEAVEAKSKIEELKKGLMNVLLTGKIRCL